MDQCGAFLQFLVDMVQFGRGGVTPGPPPPLPPPLKQRPGGGGGGHEGKKKFVYLKWTSHFCLSIQNFIFPERKMFLVLGGWVGGWFGLGGGGGPLDHPPTPWISTSLSRPCTAVAHMLDSPPGGTGVALGRH